METRANHALIGAFTLAVIAAAFAFVYWFKSGNSAGERLVYRIVFQGSVSGLSRGSVVRFNGLSVGEVTSIALVKGDPRLVEAYIATSPQIPIKADTRARLEYQGLTGVAAIQLSGGSPSAPPLAMPAGEGVPTIFADRSDFQDILETVQRLSGRVDAVIGKAEKLIADNEQSIGATVRNVEVFSKALADNSASVSALMSSVTDTAQRIGAASSRIDTLAADLDTVVRAVDNKSVGAIVNNLDAFSQNLAENRANITAILTDSASLIKSLNTSSGRLDAVLADVSKFTQAIDPQKLASIVDDIDAFSATLARSAPELDRTVANAAEISEKLNKAASRVDGVLEAAQNFLGSSGSEAGGQLKGMFAEFTETAKSIRQLSANLDKRTSEITASFNKLANGGGRDLQAIAVEARNSLNQLNRTIRSVEQNPQQFLFGAKSAVPIYAGPR